MSKFKHKFMLKIRSNKQGFSLIELLVVVTIIGVLAAVAIPSYNKYQDNAAINTAKISAKSIYKAIAICFASGQTSTCESGNVNGTLDKACTVGADTAAYAAKDACVLRVKSDSPKAYCVSVNVSDKAFCIDSAGKNNTGTTTTGFVKCGGATAVCS